MSKWPYNTQRWQRLRLAKLREHPLCQSCLERGIVEVATVVDHVVAITAGGDAYPAFDGLRSLCAPCHNRRTRVVQQLGQEITIKWGHDENGWPLDPDHPWNREGET